jgi:hypothetical protein
VGLQILRYLVPRRFDPFLRTKVFPEPNKNNGKPCFFKAFCKYYRAGPRTDGTTISRMRVTLTMGNYRGVVPGIGIEPTRPCGHRILSPARLPVPPARHGFQEYHKCRENLASPTRLPAM